MRKKDPHYVIFGAWDKPDKAIIGIRRNDSKGAGVAICRIKDDARYDFHSTDIKQEDITSVCDVLWFCKKESLDSMIDCLIELREDMKRRENERVSDTSQGSGWNGDFN